MEDKVKTIYIFLFLLHTLHDAVVQRHQIDDQEVVGSTSGHSTTLGKLFTHVLLSPSKY